MIGNPRTTSYPIATLNRIALAPQPVDSLPAKSFQKLAHHRAIEVKRGMAIITAIGRRQLRNTQ